MNNSMANIQNSQVRIKTLYQNLQDGDQSMNIWPKQAILILGNTGAGKTTSAYILNNHTVIGQSNRGRTIYRAEKQINKATIGHTNKSQTQIPNFFQMQNGKMFIDCPGFLDTFKFERVISNAYYIYKLFSKIQSMKFIVTVNEEGFSGKGKEFVQTIEGFLALFNFTKDFTVKQVVNSTYLLVTKANRINKQCIPEILSMFTQEVKGSHFANFVDSIIQHERVVFIQAAKKGQKSPKNNILQLIQQHTTYLTRKFNEREKVYDMQQIHFQFNSQKLKPEENQLAEQALTDCNKCIETMTGRIADSLRDIMQQIQANNNKPLNFDCDFMQRWESVIQKMFSYNKKEWQQFKVTGSKIKYFNFLKLIEDCIKDLKFLQQFDGNNQSNKQPQLLDIQKFILSLLQKFIYFLPMNESQIKILKRFTFLMNRKFEEIKVLSKIKFRLQNVSERNNRETIDRLKSFQICAYELVEEKYFQKYQVEKQNDHKYYKELLDYLKKVIRNKNKTSQTSDLMWKCLKCYTFEGQLYIKERKKYEAAQCYVRAIQDSLTLYATVNKQYFCKLYKDSYQKLASLLQNLQLYQEAYEIYYILNHIPNLIRCSNQILNNLTSDNLKFSNRKNLADYLITIARIDEAVKFYQEAIYYGTGEQQQTISNKIIWVLDDKQILLNQYKDKLKNKQYYNRIPTTFKLSEVLKKIKNKDQKLKQLEEDEDLFV